MSIKQNVLKAITTLCIIMAVATSHAYFIVDGIYYNIISEEEKTVEVTLDDMNFSHQFMYTRDIVIPSKITYEGNEYTVTSIGNYAFQDSYALTSVEIPSSVTSIGYGAFYSCYNLTSVNMPSGITFIGDEAFYDSGIKFIEIPSKVTSIGNRVFYSCENLTSIEIPNTIVSIGEEAFAYSGLESVEIPGSVTSIGNKAFFRCYNLLSVVAENCTASIGGFSDCNKLTSVVIGDNVTSIQGSAFRDCNNLSNVKIGSNVKSIERMAFQACSNLTFVEIPNSVTSIGDYAFWSCSGMKSVVIGSGVNSIGHIAFGRCNLESVYCKAITPPTTTDEFNSETLKGTLFVPKGTKEAYSSANHWMDFQNIIEIDDKDFPTSITTTVVNGDDFSISADGNTINVHSTGSSDIKIYTTDGNCVYSGSETTISNLPRGVYIVKCGDKAKKISL